MSLEQRFVRIEWHDACDEEHTWVPDDEAKEFGEQLVEVISWGWIVSETKKYVTLAADYIPSSHTWGRVTKIPRKMCAKIDEFKQE